MTVFYYDKEKAEQGILYCLGQEDKILTQEEIIEQGKEELYKNSVTYIGDTVLIGYPILDGKTVRKATDKELIDKGIITLGIGEVLDGDCIKTIPKPKEYYYAYEWNHPNWVLNQSLLPDGTYYDGENFIKVPIPDGANIVWNREINAWEERGTEEEMTYWYYKKIESIKDKVMENGCWYIDKEGKKHRQKTRSEKDISLLCSVIYKLETKMKLGEENPTEDWSFGDFDIKEIDLDEALEINLKCGEFVSSVYKAEAILKSQRVDKELSFEKFSELVDSISETKIYRKEEQSTMTFGSW